MDKFVTVYVDSGNQTVQQIHEINESIGILVDAGVKSKEIRVFDVSEEPVLKDWLKIENNGRLQFPQTYVFLARLGSVSALREGFADGSLQKVIKLGPPEAPEPAKYPTGAKDTWIDGADWLLRGMVHGLKSCANLLPGSPRERDNEKNMITPPADVNKRPSAVVGERHTATHENVSFSCVRTNWYWRRQPRVYRFDVGAFYRIEPESDIVKEIFPYGEVKEIYHEDGGSIIIKFKEKSKHHDQHFSCVEASRLAETMMDRAGKVNIELERKRVNK